jgi:hypothetical protein
VMGSDRIGDATIPLPAPPPFQRQRLDRPNAIKRLGQMRALGLLRKNYLPVQRRIGFRNTK